MLGSKQTTRKKKLIIPDNNNSQNHSNDATPVEGKPKTRLQPHGRKFLHSTSMNETTLIPRRVHHNHSPKAISHQANKEKQKRKRNKNVYASQLVLKPNSTRTKPPSYMNLCTLSASSFNSQTQITLRKKNTAPLTW